MEELYYLYQFDRTKRQVTYYKLFSEQGFGNISQGRDWLESQGFDRYLCIAFLQPANAPASELEMTA